MTYGGDVDRGPFLNAINWVFNSIALVTVLLRLVSRRTQEKKSWAIDEVFILLAMSTNLARAIYVSITISKGYGRHLDALLEENPIAATALLRLLVILQAIGLWTFTLPKLPVVALLVRLFNTSKRVAITLYGMTIALLLLVFVMTILTFVQCTPVAFQWDPEIEGGHCWKRNINVDLGYLAGAYSAMLDFSFALYPILQVSKLQMERSRKIVVAGSLSLGFLACITTIYKLTTISEITSDQDPTWATIPLEVWNSVEGTVLIIAASVPLTRPIMIIFAQGFIDITSRLSSITLWSGARTTRSTKLSERTSRSNRGHQYSRQHDIPKSKDNILLLESHVSYMDIDDARHIRSDEAGIFKTVDIRVEGTDR